MIIFGRSFSHPNDQGTPVSVFSPKTKLKITVFSMKHGCYKAWIVCHGKTAKLIKMKRVTSG